MLTLGKKQPSASKMHASVFDHDLAPFSWKAICILLHHMVKPCIIFSSTQERLSRQQYLEVLYKTHSCLSRFSLTISCLLLAIHCCAKRLVRSKQLALPEDCLWPVYSNGLCRSNVSPLHRGPFYQSRITRQLWQHAQKRTR